MSAMPDLAETREIVGLLVALVGQTATQMSQCAEQCGLSVVQASALLQLDGSMSMRELAARLGGHASNATGIADRLAARGLVDRHEDTGDRRVNGCTSPRKAPRPEPGSWRAWSPRPRRSQGFPRPSAGNCTTCCWPPSSQRPT